MGQLPFTWRYLVWINCEEVLIVTTWTNDLGLRYWDD